MIGGTMSNLVFVWTWKSARFTRLGLGWPGMRMMWMVTDAGFMYTSTREAAMYIPNTHEGFVLFPMRPGCLAFTSRTATRAPGYVGTMRLTSSAVSVVEVSTSSRVRVGSLVHGMRPAVTFAASMKRS